MEPYLARLQYAVCERSAWESGGTKQSLLYCYMGFKALQSTS